MHTAKPVHDGFEAARLAGADAYIVKGVATEELMATLQHLEHREGQCLCVAGTASLPPRDDTGRGRSLTPCETRVVELLSQGLTQKEVAAGLGCSLRNVQKLVENAKKHLGARSREQLIRRWLEGRRGS